MPLPVAGEMDALNALHCQRGNAAHLIAIRDAAVIRAIMARPRRVRTTDSRHDLPIAPNLLDRNFIAIAPNRIWLADITYIETDQGWLYLAAVMDLYSRRIVGWAMRDHLRAE